MLEKLSSTDRTGDFVHNSQTMSGDAGFRNVSKLWYDQNDDIAFIVPIPNDDKQTVKMAATKCSLMLPC